MIERYLKHILKEQYNRDVKSLRITRKHEYTATTNIDTVFYTIHFDYIDYIEHKNCNAVLRVDFHSYEVKDEMYTDFLSLTLT